MANPAKRDARGSLWRRWDLHFHTPASFDYDDKSVTNADIVNGLRETGVSVVAITDHHTIDVDRFEELRALAGDDITFFPGIELRCELGGSEAIHYIGIFPENANVRMPT
jgi:predicted metal-dependent phosphoesterase TrpH